MMITYTERTANAVFKLGQCCTNDYGTRMRSALRRTGRAPGSTKRSAAIQPSPADLIRPAPSLTVVTAIWDDASLEWTGGPALTESMVGGEVVLSVSLPRPGQIALVVADEPSLTATAGAPLPALSLPALSALSGTLVADPDVIIASPEEQSHVFIDLSSSDPLVSGAAIEARLDESYELRPASGDAEPETISGGSSRQDVIAYRHSMRRGAEPPDPTRALAAVLQVRPSQSVDWGDIREGRIHVEVALPQTEGPGLAGEEGTEVTGPGGLSLEIPPGAAGGSSPVVTLSDASGADFPAGIASPAFDLRLQVDAGLLDPSAEYRLYTASSLFLGDEYVIGQAELLESRKRIRAVAFGRVEPGPNGDAIVIHQCKTYDTTPVCLGGFGGAGAYALFAASNGIALAAGTVLDSLASPGANLVVQADAIPVTAVTDGAGAFRLPIPAAVSSTLTARDRVRDLNGSIQLTPASAAIVTADIELLGTPLTVLEVYPPRHGNAVPLETVIQITFQKPIAQGSLLADRVALWKLRPPDREHPAAVRDPVLVRLSLSADGRLLYVTPSSLLDPNSTYELVLSSSITDRGGNPLRHDPQAPAEVGFASDFSTKALFQAEELPPNTLWVSLPQRDPELGDTDMVGIDEPGTVFVCGGAQLAYPGTDVVVTQHPRGMTGAITGSVIATDWQGQSSSTECDFIPEYQGRCNTDEPGSFCIVFGNAVIGDRFTLLVEDALGNVVELEAGRMRDERTGAEAVDAEGAVITYPADPRYQAFIPEGAFPETTVFQLAPLSDNELAVFPQQDNPEFTALFTLLAGVRVDLTPPDRKAEVQYDVAVPAPPDASAEQQFIATQVVNFRGQNELTMVDTAYFDAEGCAARPELGCRIITDPSLFPGLTIGGSFGLQRVEGCIGYVTGWVSTGDHSGLENGGFLGASGMNTMLPFPVDQGERLRYALPIPCNQPVEITLHAPDGSVLATTSCTDCSIGAQGVADLPGVLTDDQKYPAVDPALSSLRNGAVLAPWQRIELTFDESMDPNTLDGNVELRVCGPSEGEGSDPREQDCEEGNVVPGHGELSTDGRILVFVPDTRLRYGLRYRLSVDEVKDLDGQAMAQPFYLTFSTHLPRVLGHIERDIRDVAVIDSAAVGREENERYVALAEGDALRVDSAGGVVLYDVTNPKRWQEPLSEGRTAGVDRAVTFVSGSSITTTGQSGGVFHGPFLMSVDGPGGPDRFGVWRVYDLSEFPALRRVASRLINQSQYSLERITGIDSLHTPPSPYELGELTQFVLNDVGIPLDVIGLGPLASYIANSPHIGLELILPDGMSSDFLTERQVHGTFRGEAGAGQSYPVRAVATLPDPEGGPSYVLALSQYLGHQLLLLTPDLTFKDSYILPPEGLPMAVSGLEDWPVRVERQRPGGGSWTDTEPHDLSAAACQGNAVCVIPVNAERGTFEPHQLSGGPGVIVTPGGVRGALRGDPGRQLLYTGDGTAGLSIVDLSVPAGSIDETDPLYEPGPDEIDDRVLGSVVLPERWSPDLDPFAAVRERASARRLAVYTDPAERPHAAVAADAAGLYLIAEAAPLVVEKPEVRSCAYEVDGDTIGCEDQRLGEVVGLVGTPYTLHYSSARTPGWTVVKIPVLGTQVPADVDQYEVTVRVAGNELVERYAPEADLTVLFAWDHQNAEGEVALGAELATIEVAEIYSVNGQEYRWNRRVWGGTLGSWDTRAHGLGGWSLSVHHFFDPLDRILYLGSGGQKRGAELGFVEEDADEVRIASEGGVAVYGFERKTGRHLYTRNAVTGADLFTFTYEPGSDKLSSVTDGYGNRTTISNLSFSGPFGASTTAGAADPDGFITAVGNAVSSMSFAYTEYTGPFVKLTTPPPATPAGAGLLEKTVDPNGGTWEYGFDVFGKLEHQSDAAGGGITVTGESIPASGDNDAESVRVSLQTGGGSTFDHQLVRYPDGPLRAGA